jgi:hypothetical protein
VLRRRCRYRFPPSRRRWGCRLRSCSPPRPRRCHSAWGSGVWRRGYRSRGWAWCRRYRAGWRLGSGLTVLTRHRSGYSGVATNFVRRVVLGHPVRGGFAQAFGIFVYDGLLVVEEFGIVHEALAVALQLGERRIFSAVELVLRVRLLAGVQWVESCTEATVPPWCQLRWAA